MEKKALPASDAAKKAPPPIAGINRVTGDVTQPQSKKDHENKVRHSVRLWK